MREVIITPILERFDQKDFNNLELTLGMALKSNGKVEERLKLKVRNFWE